MAASEAARQLCTWSTTPRWSGVNLRGDVRPPSRTREARSRVSSQPKLSSRRQTRAHQRSAASGAARHSKRLTLYWRVRPRARRKASRGSPLEGLERRKPSGSGFERTDGCSCLRLVAEVCEEASSSRSRGGAERLVEGARGSTSQPLTRDGEGAAGSGKKGAGRGHANRTGKRERARSHREMEPPLDRRRSGFTDDSSLTGWVARGSWLDG